MAEYKATPDQWETIAEYAKDLNSGPACLLELRARVEALEASQQQPEPIDQEKNDRRFHECMDLIHNATPDQIRAAAGLPERPASKVYEISKPLQLTPEQAQQINDLLAPNSQPTPNPSQMRSSLVERVQQAINTEYDESLGTGSMEARAAIREVAAWLKETHGWSDGSLMMLEQEAER